MAVERFFEWLNKHRQNRESEPRIVHWKEEANCRLRVIDNKSLSESEKRMHVAQHAAEIMADTDPHIELIYCFGSVARGTAKPNSDIDLMCLVDDEIEMYEDERARIDMLELVLQACGYRVGGGPWEISIAMMPHSSFLDPSLIFNPELVMDVQRDGKLLFERI